MFLFHVMLDDQGNLAVNRGIVHPPKNLFTHPHVVPNPQYFGYSPKTDGFKDPEKS